MTAPLIAFYGDDFTGSTDVMEVLTWAGIPTVLFFAPPDLDTARARFPDARAIGIAGTSRSWTPDEMDTRLPDLFAALGTTRAPLVHYKVCSTFDSAPHIGSIGRAIEIGIDTFGVDSVPLVVGAPFLRRYVAFSNLFARVDDTVYRLDRHPTMRVHPITPMGEADLRLHLAAQTELTIAPFTLLHLAEPAAAQRARYKQMTEAGARIILFDTLDDDHLRAIGALIAANSAAAVPHFVCGSSGVERALTLHWTAQGKISPVEPPQTVGAADRLLVVSGSAAPATAAQIAWAEAHGFALVRLDTARLVSEADAETARAEVIERALELLNEGRSVVLFSARGPDDPAIGETRAHVRGDPSQVGARLATQQGMIARALLERSGLRRLVVTGGDTCGHAAQQLGIDALTALLPIAPGAPLCRAHSLDPRMDGVEIALKAGQVGAADYFGSVQRGRA